MNRKDEWAEQWVDSALMRLRESSPPPEPDAGWEARLLQQLQKETQPARHTWWRPWITAVGLAATCGILLWLALPAIPGPPQQRAWAPPAVYLPGPPAPEMARARRTVAPRRHPVYSSVFPTPTPLTEQERLLLRYVALASPGELRRMAKSAPSGDDAFSSSFGSSR